MAISHAIPGNQIETKQFGTALSGQRTHALIKSADLEVIRIVLLAGAEIPPHAVAGEITVQCIEGRVAFHCAAGVRELSAGQMIHLVGNDVHLLRSLKDASLLLTIALKSNAVAAGKL